MIRRLFFTFMINSFFKNKILYFYSDMKHLLRLIDWYVFVGKAKKMKAGSRMIFFLGFRKFNF